MTTPEQWELNRRKLEQRPEDWVAGRVFVNRAIQALEAEGVHMTHDMREHAMDQFGRYFYTSLSSEGECIQARARTLLLSLHAANVEVTRANNEGESESIRRLGVREGWAVAASAVESIMQKRYTATVRAAAKAADAGCTLGEIQARAAEVFQSDPSAGTLIVNVIGYKAEGKQLVVSCSTLGGAILEARVCRGDSIRDLARAIHETKFGRKASIETDFGFKASVEVFGPRGARLHEEMPLPEALDYEGDANDEDEEGEFYSLAVLTGDAWRELGLQGATRWQYLRESEFIKLFGMTKATFKPMPTWKQIPLKKKHGLF